MTVMDQTGGSGSEPTVHQLRLLLAMAEELHFGRAAARLFITQPALSRQLRSLEQRLGCELFDRSNRRVEPTAACRTLLPEARAVVEAMDRLSKTAGAVRRGAGARLRVGSIGAEGAMPHVKAVLNRLRTAHPHLTVDLRNLNFVDHTRRLLDGDVDVAFLRPPVPPGIHVLHMVTEPRIACLPASDPLAARSSVTLAELAGRPMVDVPEEASRLWWDFWAVDPRPDGSPVRYGPVAADVEGLLHTVGEGSAMAFMPAAARTFFPRPDIAYLDVPDLTPCGSALAWAAAARTRPEVVAIRDAAETLLLTPAALTGPQL